LESRLVRGDTNISRHGLELRTSQLGLGEAQSEKLEVAEGATVALIAGFLGDHIHMLSFSLELG